MPVTERTLHGIFERRAREAPDRVAVTWAAEHVTYGELNERADRLAARLRARGAGPGTLVGLLAERGVELVAGVIGILKAGAAYVPVDPAYPDERVRFLLADSGASLVVTGRDVLDGPAPAPVDDPDLAYAIYTSGTTGVPKAVPIAHGQVVRLFVQTRPWFGFDDRDVWTLFHSVSFDFSVWEIWGALLHGGRLVVVPADATRSPERFHDLLRAERVTILNQTPSAFRQLAAADQSRPADALDLRLVIIAGERLDVSILAPWIARHGDRRPALANMYGITETTILTSYRPIVAGDLSRPDVSPIGVPIPDLRMHLLDAARRAVADGEPGDLYVAGPALARGYLRRPDLTAERFVDVPGVDPLERRLYDSGDRAVRLPDGGLAYLGRADDQLKVRGFRIEPREIALSLRDHPLVDAIEVAGEDFGDGDVRLVAYVLPRPGAAVEELVADLTGRAAAALPAHMRPSTYRIVPEMPMTLQGKVDRRALRELAARGPAGRQEPGSSLTDVEDAVLRIVETVMERTGVGVEDDLFDLGATSLALVRVITGVNQRFGVVLTGAELEDTASVRNLASCVENARAEV